MSKEQDAHLLDRDQSVELWQWNWNWTLLLCVRAKKKKKKTYWKRFPSTWQNMSLQLHAKDRAGELSRTVIISSMKTVWGQRVSRSGDRVQESSRGRCWKTGMKNDPKMKMWFWLKLLFLRLNKVYKVKGHGKPNSDMTVVSAECKEVHVHLVLLYAVVHA